MSTTPKRAVILAGGKGARLAPYTATIPKPLVPIGDMPILELVLRQLSQAKVEHVTLTVNHLAALLRAYFADGGNYDLNIDYSFEDEPLGTAGPLTLVEKLDASFFVLNGDLLTDIDYQAMFDSHIDSGALLTVGLYERTHVVDFGVVDLDASHKICGYREKPSLDYCVSMGVYVMEPEVLKLLSPGEFADLPDLVETMLGQGMAVNGYVHKGYWLDIGRPEDYEQAQLDFPNLRERLIRS